MSDTTTVLRISTQLHNRLYVYISYHLSFFFPLCIFASFDHIHISLSPFAGLFDVIVYVCVTARQVLFIFRFCLLTLSNYGGYDDLRQCLP